MKKLVDLAFASWVAALLMIPAHGQADTAMKTAMANCREEAVSTGLVDDADISAYVELCMQSWQTPFEQVESGPDVEGLEDSVRDMPEAR